MITLENNALVFRFPDVHSEATCAVDFQRTLRIPDDGKDYPLPPGLGRFPLRHLDDFADRTPDRWRKRGGVVAPMHQAEALWISFLASSYPFALKIATGKINAVTGEAWTNHLNDDPQDYVVIPSQPWLDGYCVEKDIIRQFVAMPLGEGYSAEEQITDSAQHGGLQIIAYPMKAERYAAEPPAARNIFVGAGQGPVAGSVAEPDMGIAPGGRMKQEIYDDPYGLDAWDQRHASRCFLTIANSNQWMAISGEAPPREPPTAAQYTAHGLPWFDYYDADKKALEGSTVLGNLKGLAEMTGIKSGAPLSDNESINVETIKPIRPKGSNVVREAEI